MIVTLGSVRGSPGVTSWALLLAAGWPAIFDTDRVVLEADVDGGVLGARYGLGVDPGVVSLIAAMRRSGQPQVPVADHGRAAADRVWLVPGPETAERAHSVWTGTAEAVAAGLAADDRVWFVDAGRVDASSAVLPFVAAAKLTVLLCRSAHEDVVQVPSRLEALGIDGPKSAVLVVGKLRHSVDELAAFFGTPTVWNVDESTELPELAAAVMRPGRARRSWLWRSAVELSARVAVHTSAPRSVGSDLRTVGSLNGTVESRFVETES